MRDLGFAALLVMMMPLAVMSTFIGVLLWVWLAMLSPTDSLVGFMVGVQINKIVFGIVVLSMFATKEKKSFYLDPVGVVLILFCASATVSFITAISSPDLASDIYQKLLKETALALCAMWVMTTRRRLQALALTIVIAMGFIGVKEGLIGILTAGGHQIIGVASVGDNNSLATALLMMIPFALYVSRHLVVRPMKLGLLAVAGLSVVTILLTKSRGGMGGLVVLAILLILRSEKKLIGLVGVAAAGLAIFVLAPPELFSRLDTVNNLEGDTSALGRFVAWKVSLLIAFANPLFGGGGHAVQYFPVWSRFIPYIGSVDFIPTPVLPSYAVAAHSIYFEILGDNGFLGLGLFLSMLAVTLFNCWSIMRTTRRMPGMRWAGELAQASMMSIVLYMTTGALLSLGYFEMLYVIVAMVSACRRVVRTAASEAKMAGQRGDGPMGALPPGLRGWQPGPLARPGALTGGALAQPGLVQRPPRPAREVVRRV